MSNAEEQMKGPPLAPEKIERNIAKLAEAVERLYGGAASLIWRNFLAGFSRAIGLIAAYLLFIALGIFIAYRTGAFQMAQNFWSTFSQNLPFRELQQIPNIKDFKLDPALFPTDNSLPPSP